MSQSTAGILPGTRFAVEAYVNFVRDRPILEGIASSLTEMFSPGIIADRVRGMLANYDFITEETLAYFTPRLTQAPQDVDFALAYVKQHATTRADQEAVLAALRFKCDVLWAQLDALYYAYVEPGLIPPGAFVPEGSNGAGMMDRFVVSDASVLAFAPHIVFRFDEVRQRWIILAPERLMLPDEQAVEILQLVDGKTGVARHRRFAGRPLQPGAARADRQGRHRHAAGPRRQGMPRRCRPALTRRSPCWPS